jgi:hypothetical protein
MKTPKLIKPSDAVLKKVHALRGKKGMIAAVEPKSGEWFLGETLLQAVDKGRKKHPTSQFYIIRVGYNAAYSLGGTLRRI